MSRFSTPRCFWSIAFGLLVAFPCQLQAAPNTPEQRAIDYLASQVPQWPTQNKCFSCHNNGDGARALLTAVRLGHKVKPPLLRSTLNWLQQPDAWHKSGSEEFKDKRLATIQFAAAQREARRAGLLRQGDAMLRAAELVAAEQSEDGCWKIDAAGTVGSPATYGPVLATAVSLQILNAAVELERESHERKPKYARHAALATQWLRRVEAKNVLDASAVIIGLRSEDVHSQRPRMAAVQLLRRTHNARSGGWGPFNNSASEPFDTAMAVIALTHLKSSTETETLISSGRRHLEATQLDEGGWPETTRPAGGESYAQHMSTSAWATIALLVTKKP